MGIFKRKPDFIVGTEADPYLLRWWIIPRNRWFNIDLHKFLRDDDDRALHDHPWWSLSIILRGGYYEWMPRDGDARWFATQQGKEGPTLIRKWRAPGSLVFRRATQAHRVQLEKSWTFGGVLPRVSLPSWTLFITGPRVREWGFHCPQGWRHWREFTKPGAPGEIGPGCE